MKEINLALGLKEDASVQEAVEAIETLEAASAKSAGLPKGISAEALKEKMAAGLSKEHAIEVLNAQAAHDSQQAKAAKSK